MDFEIKELKVITAEKRVYDSGTGESETITLSGFNRINLTQGSTVPLNYHQSSKVSNQEQYILQKINSTLNPSREVEDTQLVKTMSNRYSQNLGDTDEGITIGGSVSHINLRATAGTSDYTRGTIPVPLDPKFMGQIPLKKIKIGKIKVWVE